MTSHAQDLIIHARHALSPWRRRVSWLLTLLCWWLWLALWWPVVGYLLYGEWDSDDQLPNLRAGAGAIVLIGAALVAWARVNYWRFADKEQRSRVRDVAIEALAADLGVPASVLRVGLGAQVVVVHHLPEGGIERVDALCLTLD